MKKLVLVAALLLGALPAYAAGPGEDILYGSFDKMGGGYMSATDTDAVMDFGFTSSMVRVCPELGSEKIYIRLGTNITNASSPSGVDMPLTVYAPDAATFQTGALTLPTPNAATNTTVSTSGDQLCFVLPIRARGIAAHWVTSASASLDVQVFGNSKNQ